MHTEILCKIICLKQKQWDSVIEYRCDVGVKQSEMKMSDVQTSRLLTTGCMDDCEDDNGDHRTQPTRCSAYQQLQLLTYYCEISYNVTKLLAYMQCEQNDKREMKKNTSQK